MLGLRACGYLSTRTICVSNAVRNRIVQDYGYPRRRTTVVLNGIDVQHFSPSGRDRATIRFRARANPGDAVIVCVARLGRLKRIDVLLEAMAQLRQQRPKIVCVIVGDGPLRSDLEQRAAALKVDDIVHFAGHFADVREHLEAADVYVSTSELEGFGLAVAEAMAIGLPCVVTDIGGHDEMVVHDETGLLVPVGSATAVASAVNRILGSPELRERLVTAARARVDARFTLDAMIDRYDAIFHGKTPVPY
jgi:glycosyltransferase involved in cell wall biosynthesis